MQSPLEHNPELVALLGLVTVRWAALEDAMAELVGAFLAVDDTGHIVLYSMSAFSQRLEFARATVKSGLREERHVQIAERLFDRIGGLWATRNHFAHAHYVHRAEYKDGMEITLIREDGFGIRPETIPTGDAKVKSRSFGYMRYSRNQKPRFVPVNTGAISNHAESVLRRGRQLLVLSKAVQTGVAPLRLTGEITHQRLSPRSPMFNGAKPAVAHVLRAPPPKP